MMSYETTTTRLAREELGACILIEDLLPLYMEGEVSPGSRDLIVEHLARCERCAGFLAGAQSVRAQLRRDSIQRAGAIVDDRPEQRAVTRGQWLATAIAVLTACGIGGLGAGLILDGSMSGSSGGEVTGGAVLSLISFSLLLALARSRASLTLARVLAVLGGCGGAAAGIGVLFGSNSEPPAVILGMLLCVLGFAAIWTTIWRSGQPATSATPPISPAIQSGALILLGGAASLLVGVPLLAMVATFLFPSLQGPVPTALLVLLAAVVVGKFVRRAER
jgi:hypothetical protein